MLPEPDPARCRALAADLRAARFDADALRAAWGELADTAIVRGLTTPAVRALGDRDDPLAVLGRLLVLGMPQPAASVSAALPNLGIAGLTALGLASADAGTAPGDRGTITPLVLVRPQSFADAHGSGQWWIASDLDEAALGGPLPEDHVLGVGGASLTLAGLQSVTSATRALDIGTGCGIQALRARRDVGTVVATDVSEHALRFTRLNALLNDVDGIETRSGSLFAPVEGEQFDVIVSNPPFVITPRVSGVPSYEYRDGGMRGDDLVAAVIAGVGAHLVPGGEARLLGNWEHRPGRTGLERVREWVGASHIPLDAWIIEREVLDPLAYAELWVRDGGTLPGSAAYAALIDAWLTDFDERGVTGVGFGYIVLRRPADGIPRLERYERIVNAIDARTALGAHITDALAAHDRVAALDDDELASTTLVVVADVTEARHHLPGAEGPSVIELRQGGGFARTIEVDPGLAAFVGACDGDLPVGALLDAIATLLDVEADALRSALLPEVRELLMTGFLRFA